MPGKGACVHFAIVAFYIISVPPIDNPSFGEPKRICMFHRCHIRADIVQCCFVSKASAVVPRRSRSSSMDPQHTTIDVCMFRVEGAGDERGSIAVAVHDMPEAGMCVLREDPVVFASSLLATSNSGAQLGKQCWACGRLLLSCSEDWERCQRLLSVPLPSTTPSYSPAVCPEAVRAIPAPSYKVVVVGSGRPLFLCNGAGDTCLSLAERTLGLRYLVEEDNTADHLPGSAVWGGLPTVHDMVLGRALVLPTTRREALEALWEIAETLNERVWMLVKWLCRILCASTGGQRPFEEVVNAELSDYAEGAPQSLNAERRALMRYTAAIVNVWLASTASSTSAAQPTITAQTLLRMVWVLDANSHTYIVTSPLFTWASFVQGGPQKEDDGVRHLTRRMLDGVDAAVLHACGVAIYRKGSKFNHACLPNVQFLPSSQRAEALVITRAGFGIAAGDELLTSYIDLDNDAMESRDARRMLLLRNYGFLCSCPKCSPPLGGAASTPTTTSAR